MVLRVYARTALTLHYSDGAKEICEHYDFERYAFSFTVFYTLKFIRRNTYTCVEYINPRLSTPTLSEIRVYRSCFHFSKWRNKKQLDHIIFPQPCTHQNAQNHEAPLAELGTLRVRFAHLFTQLRASLKIQQERGKDLFKIQQKREKDVFKIQQERGKDLFKIQQEREKDLFKIQQERERRTCSKSSKRERRTCSECVWLREC